MLFRKNKLDKLSKNISAHDRAHDLNALMSGEFFESKNERAHDQHLYSSRLFKVIINKTFF